jgi:hypothetical protein
MKKTTRWGGGQKFPILRRHSYMEGLLAGRSKMAPTI